MRTDLKESLKLVGLEGGTFSNPTEDQILDLERALKLKLPADFKFFIQNYAPSLFEANVHFRLLEPSPLSENGEQRIDVLFGISYFDPFDILRNNDYRFPNSPAHSVVFARDSAANKLMVCCDDNRVLFHDREHDKYYLVAKTFADFIDSFVIRIEPEEIVNADTAE